MEGGFAKKIEDLFKKNPKLVNFLCPSLEPPQFRSYAKEILKGEHLKEVLSLLGLTKSGVKEEKIKRLFHHFYPGDYPQIERTSKPPGIQDDKFIMIIQSILEDQQTPPAIRKIFLSFFNRKEDTDSIRNLIKSQKVQVKHLKQFLHLVGCEVGSKNKEDKVNRVLQYLRPPSTETPTKIKSESPKPDPSKTKETPKKAAKKEKGTPESKKRKLAEGENTQTKKAKTEQSAEKVNIQPETKTTVVGQDTPKQTSMEEKITTQPKEDKPSQKDISRGFKEPTIVDYVPPKQNQ